MTHTPQFDIIRRGNAYFVRQDGADVHGPDCHLRAVEAMERLQRAARLKSRPCLVCGTTFKSEGPHNRMCGPCRTRSFYDGAA